METNLTKNLLAVLLILIPIRSSFSQLSNKLEPIDVFDLEYVSNPQISSQGDKILYQRNFKDIMTDSNLSNIWIVNFDGSDNRPVTTGNSNDFSPRWSNSGKMFTYNSDLDGNTQLYLHNLENNTTQKLTNLQSSVGKVEWSDDDKYLLFTSFVENTKNELIKMPPKPEGAEWNKPPIEIDDMVYRYDGGGYRKNGNTQIFILPVEGGTPRQVSDIEKNANSPIWLDKNRVLFSANLHDNSDFEPNNSEIYLLNIRTGDVSQLTRRFGPDFSPIVSPDKTKIAFLGYDDKFLGYQQSSLYVMDPDGDNVKMISKDFDRNIQNITWSGDGKGLFFQYVSEGMTRIAYMSLSGKVKDIVDELGGLSLGRPYSGASYSISKNGRYAFTYGNVYNPSDLASGYNGCLLYTSDAADE